MTSTAVSQSTSFGFPVLEESERITLRNSFFSRYASARLGAISNGYYVDTVGKNESRIAEYIENQLKEDEMGEQLVIPSVSPFTGRK